MSLSPIYKMSCVENDLLRFVGGSVAGDGTSFAFPSLGVVFDCGLITEEAITCPVMLISHLHLDHIATLHMWISQRHWRGMVNTTILCNNKIKDRLFKYLEILPLVENKRNDFKLVGMDLGESYQIKPNYHVRCVSASHSIGACGWVVQESRNKLLAKYQHLSKDEIGKLAKSGIKVSSNVIIDFLYFTGDTKFTLDVKNQILATKDLVITECTFCDPDMVSDARSGGHCHSDDFKQLVGCDYSAILVFGHASPRSSPDRYREALSKHFPVLPVTSKFRDEPCWFNLRDNNPLTRGYLLNHK